MDKFKKYIGKTVNTEKIKDFKFLQNCGLYCERIPDDLSEFEEIEFTIDNIVMCVAILEGKIKRIMLVKVDSSEPDACSPLNREELEEFLKKNEEKLITFFENIIS
ncbi:hypothetical protein TAGGR_1227 [Thermodesulfovibrio aggregans]|uniref:Uncharacterized protein n=1 Tax=Thermodesulfovibrio aggregans TaxID=86166 RepID=A0A0U9HLT9_9BACT|nr:hypothetical protein [Thermodesulfovibrio aggregans]GAQ94056.1 hypothetical protein TAGGR_1227 [Thermodesulfovibrio aggregans]